MPRFSANLGHLFADRPLIERIGAAAAAGFQAIELQFPYELAPSAVKAEIDRHGLTMLNINTPLGRPGDIGTGALTGREEDFATCFRQALDYVVAIGGTSIHVMSGIVPPEKRPAAETTYVANLARAAGAAAAQSIMLLIEPLNTRDRPDYFVSRVEHAADIIAKVGRPNLKIMYDCYHVQVMQGDIIRRLEKHLPLVGHIQFAGAPSRSQPEEGELNFPVVFAAIDAMGWQGWVGAEYTPRGRTEDGLGWARPYGVVPRS